MENDYDSIAQLLKDGKHEEAKAAFKGMITQEMSQEEKGKAYFDFTMTYLKVTNDINQKYLESLKEILGSLEEVEQIEEENNKMIDTAIARKDVNEA